MSMDNVIEKIRIALCDNTEPYLYSGEELYAILELAAANYSKYKPAKKKGTIYVELGKSEYSLPNDFQTWIGGLENYDIFDGIVDLGFSPMQSFEIKFSYLATRTPEEIPTVDLPLLVDYTFYFIIDGAIKETSDISALKLGKGLQIQFSNINELNKAAERRLKGFNDKLMGSFGGWV